MLDTKMLSQILETEIKDKKNGIPVIRKIALTKLGYVRNLVKNESDFSEYGRDSEGMRRWLYDNFPRLEETVRSEISQLWHIFKFRSNKKILFFYNVFLRLSQKALQLEEKDVDLVFRMCNEHGDGLELKEARSLPCIFRIAVCVRICECFDEAASGGNGKDLLSETEHLFYSLDNLLTFSEQDALRYNAVEKMLRKDPAGLYTKLTEKTKSSYRNNLSRLARRSKRTEFVTAQDIVEICRTQTQEKRHIGTYLCDKPHGGGVYLVLLVFLSLLFTTLLCLISPLFALGFLPVYGCTKLLLDKIYNRFILRDFCVPCVKLGGIPDGQGVMVVITTLLTGDERDEQVFTSLERMYFSNGGKNVYFGVLCDLCDSMEKHDKKDDEIISRANGNILRLRNKYGDAFFLFLREREYSESEEKYIAPERKRGAVAALTELLCMKNDVFSQGSIKPSGDICENVRYIFTLDSDTNLAFDCLNKLVGIMIHPQNTPVADKQTATVTKGYGILQPNVNPTVRSSKKSFFSCVMCGHGGIDGYNTGGGGMLMPLFGVSFFCGKGMFEKNCFYATLCGKNGFKKNTVLSHDAPEGARLRCAYVPDVTLTDSFPSECLSYYKRQHRWIRGDIQNFRFLMPYVSASDGKKMRNRINFASRFFMWQNIYSCLIPVFTVFLLGAALFCEFSVGAALVTVAMSVYMLPFVYSVFSLSKIRMWHNIRRHYFSTGVYTGVWTSFMRMLFEITDMVKLAYVSLDAIFRSFYRSIFSHKKMLEWITASQNDREKKDGLLGYIKKNLVSALFGAAFFVISPFGFVKIIALMWLFMPVFAYHAGRDKENKKHIPSEKQRKKLAVYCEDMWRFFSENVSELTFFLPTDNISLYPERKMSRMTSPTNIGFYLLSAVCARKLGLIDSRELDKRLLETMLSVDSIEKYEGLLFNWYDVFKKEPMNPKYISSVDLGNYIACLVCVNEALEEYKDELPQYESIKKLLKKLMSECRLSMLYDSKRKLFYIGALLKDEEFIPDRNRYDMLMSEARILSFVAVANRYVPSEHYFCLSRRFVQGRGYMGLASWSGTAFEFFLPEIFLPSEQGTLLYEASRFAYSSMRAQGVHNNGRYVFGISESCYNEFDDASNYKYHAFGLENIALNVFKKQNVVSPYSSFLFLPFYRDEVFSNLENMKASGAYGEYGFYESLDFERCEKDGSPSVVKCFMSHHVGMSIAAAVNVLCDFQVAKWFGKNAVISSALELTHEKIPYDAYIKRTPRRYRKCSKGLPQEKKPASYVPTLYAKLCDGKTQLYAKRDRLVIKHDGLQTARNGLFIDGINSFFAEINVGGESFVFDKNSTLLRSRGDVRYQKSFRNAAGENFEASLSLTIDKNTADIVRIRMRLRQLSGRRDTKVICRFCFYPLVDTRENSKVCSFFDDSDTILKQVNDSEVYFRRNSRNLCFCTGAVDGKNKKADIENERISLCTEPVIRNGFLQSEFAISFSDSRKCAEMGFVRCMEKSFDEACSELEKRSSEQNGLEYKKRRESRIKDVLGYSMEKEETHFDFPLDSREKPLIMLCGNSFCSLLSENYLGMSFCGNVNSKRITAFSGINGKEFFGERVLFDKSFDLCKNAVEVSAYPHAVIYNGNYENAEYRVTVFVHADLPCKIIRVQTDSPGKVRFELLPHDTMNRKRYIGSGLVCFGKDEEQENKGFVFGFCRDTDGNTEGAEYDVSDKIAVNFRPYENNRNGQKEYVFCVGFSSQERAYEIQRQLRESDLCKELASAKKLCKILTVDSENVSEKVTQTLSEYFSFPKDGVCKRALVCTSEPLFLFDAVLLLYTGSNLCADKAKKIACMNPSGTLSKLLVCLFVGGYYKKNQNCDEFLETKKNGETLYRRCLSYLLDESERDGFDSLYCLCLEEFSAVCDSLNDLRTSEVLQVRKNALLDRHKNGIFL